MSAASPPVRDYASIVDRFGPERRLLPPPLREDRTVGVIDALWEAVKDRGVSWIGFYTKHPVRDEMILGARRDKPACSPLGLDGMCGRCWREHRPILLHDAASLTDGYIACDPRDRSEVVVPLFEADGSCYGVLDADSYEVGSFEIADVIGLTAVVEHAGLSAARERGLEILRL